ncbi:MAG: T9SS type A sorting domain-containing protein [Candidatus Cloacimonetes bacterium]|nr:T9SS type A sorting domain-containing protein [Candidatus Cloacimonadota bacterium]
MKNTVFLLLMVIFACLLSGTTIEVNLDGTGDYLTIQEGIDASSDGDIVLVYPGRYYEHINYNGRTITVASLNYTTGEEHYIRETVIDGSDIGSCVRVDSEEGELTTLQGFTITNGAGDLTHPSQRTGGGILLRNYSHLRVINCVITRNRASGGGGIFTSQSSIYLEGTTISYNWASYFYSGGLFTSHMVEVIFSEENRCNIYNNYGQYANDICNSGDEGDYTVIVDIFTVLEPDLYYLMGFNNQSHFEFFEIEYDILNGYVDDAEHDIYVAPDGDNSNSGISPDEPMQSISDALFRIKSDEDNPRTIHLAPGRYSPSDNGQVLPLHLKSFVSLEGAGMYDTIIDGEDYYNMLYDLISRNGYSIRNLSFENFFSPMDVEPYSIQYSCYFSGVNENLENLLIENVRFANCGDGSDPGFHNYYLIMSTRGIDINNVLIEDNESRITAFKLYGSGYGDYNIINITNTIMRNNANFSGLVYFGNENENNQLNIINFEYTGNHYDYPGWVPGAIFTHGMTIYGPSQINIINNTLSDNTSAHDSGQLLSFKFSMDVNMLNTIISGYPNYAIRRSLGNGEISQDFNLDHCLIEGGYDDIFGALFPGLVYGEVLEGDPLFDVEGEYPYYLSNTSPCVGAGTLDLPDEIVLPEYDPMGNPRILGTNIDIGAYEWNGWINPIIEESIEPVPYDFCCYPNPFNPETTVSFSLEELSEVEVVIYNVKGQKVRTLVDETFRPDKYSIVWKGNDDSGHSVGSGVYFVKLSVDNEQFTNKVILIK